MSSLAKPTKHLDQSIVAPDEVIHPDWSCGVSVVDDRPAGEAVLCPRSSQPQKSLDPVSSLDLLSSLDLFEAQQPELTQDPSLSGIGEALRVKGGTERTAAGCSGASKEDGGGASSTATFSSKVVASESILHGQQDHRISSFASGSDSCLTPPPPLFSCVFSSLVVQHLGSVHSLPIGAQQDLANEVLRHTGYVVVGVAAQGSCFFLAVARVAAQRRLPHVPLCAHAMRKAAIGMVAQGCLADSEAAIALCNSLATLQEPSAKRVSWKAQGFLHPQSVHPNARQRLREVLHEYRQYMKRGAFAGEHEVRAVAEIAYCTIYIYELYEEAGRLSVRLRQRIVPLSLSSTLGLVAETIDVLHMPRSEHYVPIIFTGARLRRFHERSVCRSIMHAWRAACITQPALGGSVISDDSMMMAETRAASDARAS